MKEKSLEEINQKLQNGDAIVLTAEEVSEMSKTCNAEEIFEKVDVVTTATFGPMCSSGAFINFGHSSPPIRMEKISLNDVPVSGGLAAVDTFIGATEVSETKENYGGAHLICDLIDGKDIQLKATAKGTDCYPRKSIDTTINKNTINEMILFNPRNAYQNYPAATNSSNNKIYTYMGILLPNNANVTYSTSGELSPLLNDPELQTIGIGTRIFLAGTDGFIAWNGTQFNTNVEKNDFNLPLKNARTLSVIGNMKEMDTRFIQPAIYEKYGISIFVGIGIPIPILNINIAKAVSIRNEQIETFVCDYSHPNHAPVMKVNYQDLQSGEICINDKKVKTAPLSSISKAREIAELLKAKIIDNSFIINLPVQKLPLTAELNSLGDKNAK